MRYDPTRRVPEEVISAVRVVTEWAGKESLGDMWSIYGLGPVALAENEVSKLRAMLVLQEARLERLLKEKTRGRI